MKTITSRIPVLALFVVGYLAVAPTLRAAMPAVNANNTSTDLCDKVSFPPAQYLSTGGSPLHVVVADFDGDGIQDIAANNTTDLIIYLSDGSGGFGPPETLSLGGYHQGIATGDFNGDGRLDLVVTNDYEETISILLNDGSGRFSAPTDFATGAIVNKVAVGDFNNDAKLDLIVLAGRSTVRLLVGNGAGQFGPPQSYSVPLGPVDLTVADFNADGDLDVAVSTYDSMKLKVLLGDGQGHLTGSSAYSLGGNSFAIASADFNRDGYSDLAVGVNNIYPDNHVAIFLGDGSGAFTLAQKVYVLDVTGVATADFNRDGKVDLAAATYGFSAVSVALGDGTGHFGAPQDVPLRHPAQYVFDVAAGDFNADGKPDLVTADYDSHARFEPGNVAVLLNLPTVKIVAADPIASESSDTGRFRVLRSGCTDEPLLVYYVAGGTATPWRDYVALTGQVVIPAGKTGTTIDVSPFDDGAQETPETVTVTLAADPAYQVAGRDSATVTIDDND